MLVNNAGIQDDVPFTDVTLYERFKIISVDLAGPFVCSREAVKQMQKQQNPEGGSIINISFVHKAFQNHIMFLMLLQRRISK